MKNKSIKDTKWYVINIKARDVQTPQRYIDAFEHINEQDPLIQLRGNRHISIKSYQKSQILEKDGTPRTLYLKLSAYDILNPDAFYDKKRKENVSLHWNPDIVANEKEVELIFVPKVHRAVFRINASVSLNYVVKYFIGSLNVVEGEDLFDVDIVKDHDIIEKILTSYKVYKVDADISYSNADRSSGFRKILDDKLREAKAGRTRMTFIGSKDQPLSTEEDGMIAAVVGISESNGSVIARVKETQTSKVSTIKTQDYPLKLSVAIKDRENDYTELYNKIVTEYGNNG